MYTEPHKKITEQLRWDFAGQLIHQFVITVWIKLDGDIKSCFNPNGFENGYIIGGRIAAIFAAVYPE